MVPHTLALIAVAVYVYRGGTATQFTVEVVGKSTKTYYIKKSGDKYNADRAGESWSCTATIYFSGSKVTMYPHDHKIATKVKEVFYINNNSIENGTVSDSNKTERNGSFSGKIDQNGQKIIMDSNPAGRTMTATIKSPQFT